MIKEYPSQEYLKECFDYDQDSGIITWRERPIWHFKSKGSMLNFNSRFSGKRAGSELHTSGKTYRQVMINFSSYLLHRIAWIIVNGDICNGNEIDHINGNGSDNRVSNLRSVTARNNKKNIKKQSNNKSGVSGVFFDKRKGKWIAYIQNYKKRVNLGTFSDFESAVKVRKDAELQYGYHKNHGTERPL